MEDIIIYDKKRPLTDQLCILVLAVVYDHSILSLSNYMVIIVLIILSDTFNIILITLHKLSYLIFLRTL